jgi:hypothetical protein
MKAGLLEWMFIARQIPLGPQDVKKSAGAADELP